MNIKKTSTYVIALSATLSFAAVASDDNLGEGRQLKTHGMKLEIPELYGDAQSLLAQYYSGSKIPIDFEAAAKMQQPEREQLIEALHEQDEKLYKLSVLNKKNWLEYEKIAFKSQDIQKFAEMAIEPAIRDKMTPDDVVAFFKLNTTAGRMEFRNMYGAGMPEMILRETGATRFLFNNDYLRTKEYLEQGDANIKSLDSSNNQWITYNLRVVPKAIGRFTELETIIFPLLVEFLPSEFSNLKKLKKIELNSRGMRMLPPVIYSLTSLEVLNLYGANKIRTLPNAIGNLKNLKDLNLGNCQLSSLPDKIWSLENLETLNLSGNGGIKTLPPNIGNLRNLKVLDISDTSIKELPNEIGNLKNLDELNIRNTLITALPESMREANLTIIANDG